MVSHTYSNACDVGFATEREKDSHLGGWLKWMQRVHCQRSPVLHAATPQKPPDDSEIVRDRHARCHLVREAILRIKFRVADSERRPRVIKPTDAMAHAIGLAVLVLGVPVQESK